MILDKVLILKGLAGVTALGGTAAAAYFVFSNNDSDAKALKKDLGLPENDSDCQLPTSNNSSTTCSLDTNKLKEIKFDGKNGDLTIENNGTVSVTLTITKTSDTTTYPKGGYKFAFQSDKDITISSASPSNKIMKNTNTEFKIKETTADGGAKTLSLEKAWDISKWGEKVNLKDCTSSGEEKQCTFGEKINLFISASDKTEEATITGSNKKIKYEEDAANHNQGFKFTTSADISLSEPNGKKIEASTGTGNPSYEIKEIDGKWYLAKKTTANAS